MTYTRHPALTFALVLLASLLGVLVMHVGIAAADTGPGAPIDDAWWSRSGALAGPLVALAAVLLVVLERLSVTRWPGLGWLRRGSVRAYLSIATGAVFGLLPAVANGTVTVSGLSVALLGGLVAMRPGGGERKGETSGEIEAP